MKLNANEINAYAAALGSLIDVGVAVAGKLKPMIALFHPKADMTEMEINAIEEEAVEDALQRRDQRAEMGKSSTD